AIAVSIPTRCRLLPLIMLHNCLRVCLRFVASSCTALHSSITPAPLLSSNSKWRKNGTLFHSSRRPLQVRAWGLLSSDDTGGGNEGDHLVAEFMNHVISTRQSWPLEGRTPTPLMPPHTVVKVQMDALMRNDWPEENSGIRTAFSFSMPNKVEEMHVGQAVAAARTWRETESYLSFEQFVTHIKETQYSPMIYCLNWEAASSVFFHGRGDWRAVHAVKVTTENADGSRKEYNYTFFLEK
ncbi:hypothetical protein KI387_017093, partial [Taxus chinensis]